MEKSFRQVELAFPHRDLTATVTIWDDGPFDPSNNDFVRGINIHLSDDRLMVGYFCVANFNLAGTPRWDDSQLVHVKDISDETILSAIKTIIDAHEEELAFDWDEVDDQECGEEGDEDHELFEFKMPPPVDPKQTEYAIMNRLHTAMALVWLTSDEDARSFDKLRRDMNERIEKIIAMGGSTFT